MNNSKIITIIIGGVFAVCTAQAAVIVSLDFQGSNGTFDFDSSTGVYNDPSGVTLSFEAFVVASSGTLNATASSYGVNATGSGDSTSQLDIPNGAESIQINFSVTNPPNPIRESMFVTLDHIVIDSFSGGDAGTFSVNGGAAVALADGNNLSGVNVIGGSVLVAVTAGAFSFEGLQLTVNVLPEPGSFALLGLSGIIIHQFRRRRAAVTPSVG